jgi:hypothetical protein
MHTAGAFLCPLGLCDGLALTAVVALVGLVDEIGEARSTPTVAVDLCGDQCVCQPAVQPGSLEDQLPDVKSGHADVS